MEMRGLSMAPWLRPGDVLLVDTGATNLRLGDVVVLRRGDSGERIVHRVVSTLPVRTKGDRSSADDVLDEGWNLEGRVVKRCRDGRWRRLRFRRSLWFLCRLNLYPGQRLPAWMSRSRIRERFGVGKSRGR